MLVAALVDGGFAAVERVADIDGEIAGHVLLSRLEAPDRCLALAPVSVRPAVQRQGIGSALIRGALSAAVEDGWGGVFVLGDPAYYQRFGFEVGIAARFSSPYPADYTMAIELRPRGLPAAHAALVYPPAFGAND